MKSPIDNRIKIEKKDKCVYWSIIYLIIMLLFSGYIEFRIIWHIMLIVIAIILLCAYPKERKQIFNNVWMFLIVFSTITIIILSIINSGDFTNVLNNLRSMGYSLASLIIIAIAIARNDIMFYNIFKRRIKWLNIMLIINTIVVAIQARGTGFLIKPSWLEQNPYYDDQVAGLFGFNATNQLGMYTVFVMLLNFSYIKFSFMTNIKKKIFLVYTIIIMIIMAVLSKYNDNAGFYIVTAMFIGIYLFFDMTSLTEKIYKKIQKLFSYIIISVIGVIAFFNIPATKAVLDKFLRNRVEAMLHFNEVGMTGSNERFYQVQYGLSHKFGWFLGEGFGTAKMVQANGHGFLHFGISSMGAYIILAGIWFFILYTLLYSKLLYGIVNEKKYSNMIMYFAVFAIILFFSVYLPVYNDARSVILIGFYAVVFRYMNFTKKQNKPE